MIRNVNDYRAAPTVGSRVYWAGDICNRPHRYEVTAIEGHFMRLRDLDDGSTTSTPIAILEQPTRWSRECPDQPVTIADPPDPYARRYGSRAKETAKLGRTEIAKLIRQDIRAAVKAGELPPYRYGVRCTSYRGGGSIDVSIKVPRDVAIHEGERCSYTPEIKRVQGAIEAILWAYNYDGSNSQIDYFDRRFYSSIEIEHTPAPEADPAAAGEDLARALAAALATVTIYPAAVRFPQNPAQA